MPSCVDLLKSHTDLGTHLQRHLQATVLGDLSSARAAFHEFASLLHGHSLSEDEIIFPAFVEAGLEEIGCNLELLSKEHTKIRRLVQEAKDRINAADAALDADTRIAWVESLHLLKEVLAHHDARERNALLPALDRALSAEAAEELAERAMKMEQEETAAYRAEHAPS
ncbi:MAG: hemerythrin domain-containing protein [Planctomycetota bacterium]|jgi:hemerythrin-like domain-containing protein